MSAAGPAISVSATRDPRRIEALRAEWTALFDTAADPSPFLSHEWLSCWWRAFGGRREPWILEARDRAGALAGLLLLVGGVGPLGVRRWRLLGNGVTGADGLDVLARAGDAPAVATPSRGPSRSWRPGASGTCSISRTSPAARRRWARSGAPLGARGASATVERGFACPGFALRGTFEAHLARVPRRETYGRRVRWLSRQPGFLLDVATTPAEAPAALEDLLRLHRLRWAADGGSSGIPQGAVEDFHREVAPRLAARGWLRLYRLHVGGAAIAAVYGIEIGRRFFYYQSGYDPEWSARSPGLVLVGRTIEDAYARGLADYDFLRGTEPYKLEWASDRRETCTLRLRAPSLRAGTAALARDAWRGARDAARAIAPARAWQALRRARRGFEARALAGARTGGGDA